MLQKIRKIIAEYWLYALVATLPFERIPSLNMAVLGRSITLRSSLIVAVTAILTLIWKERPKIKLGHPRFWLICYVVVMVLSAAFSQSPTRSITAIAATGIMILAAFLISENLNKFNPTTIFKILTAVSVAVCLFGLYQFVGDTLGLPIALTGLKAMYTKAVFGFPRIQSTGLEPLYFANFLIIPIMLTANLILNGLVKSKWYLASIFLYALTLCLTLSRGGIIASLFGLAIILVSVLFYRHNHKTVLYLIGALVLSGVVAVGMVDMSGYINHLSNPKTSNNTVQQYIKQSSTLSPTATSADSDRLANKSLALDMFKSHPITGVGVGNFGNYAHLNYDQYKTDNGSMIVNNEYYEILAETGVLGALSIIGLFLSLFYLSVKKLLTTKDVEVRAWILALLCILLSFAVQYYAFSTLYIMHIWVVVGLMMGFSLQNRSLNHSKKLGV